MIKKLALPVLASSLMLYAAFHASRPDHALDEAPTAGASPGKRPFRHLVAATGTVEAQTEDIRIGSPTAGVVAELAVRVGQLVRRGDPLFRLDDRQVRAEFEYQAANLAVARSELQRLEAQPRSESLPVAEARVREAKAEVSRAEDHLARTRSLHESRVIGKEFLVDREQNLVVARERLSLAESEWKLLQAGAWEHDKAVARALVARAESQVERSKTELERLTIRAPVDGTVLQVNVRGGEYIGLPSAEPLTILGDVQTLHVRVSIDEHDLSRFNVQAPARARLKDASAAECSLTFVRLEPYVVPKRSLGDKSDERIDTRVLQAIYAVAPPAPSLFPGQRLDVYISE